MVHYSTGVHEKLIGTWVNDIMDGYSVYYLCFVLNLYVEQVGYHDQQKW